MPSARASSLWSPTVGVLRLALALGLGAGALAGSAASAPPERLPPTNLLVFHDRHGAVRPVKSRRDWQRRRAEILRGFEQIAGALPGREKRCALDVRVEEVTDCGRYERRRITYQSEPGCRVPAWLLIPKAALESRKKFPAVLCLPPTDGQFGARVSVEPLRPHYRAYAHDLAERGFVTFAPAYPLLAEYQPDLRALGWPSGTLKAVWDNLRALDLLDAQPFVARGRYGAIGHSLGGHNAIFTALHEPRLRVLVSSCGFDSFLHYYDGKPDLWQPERGWCQTRYMPRLADYRGRLEEIPFDFHELLGALAPRPVFVSAPLRDDNFRAASAAEVVRA
ncbi:MAG: prolyl oligopeptidase family serine peptidase, partial [Verrucomicrobiales bacterium]|nr:prolyl oligopeptidase family serine peptidase [Verrucomicrobiales bacterium]